LSDITTPALFWLGAAYHDPAGTNPFKEIVQHAQAGSTVFVDLSMGDERVRKALADRICSNLLASQMSKFNRNELGNSFVVLYFEEAHNLFPKSDTEVGTDVYNKLAKEGAKFHISMVYATQSMSTAEIAAREFRKV
jgi:DNA helicase HerA-like ATPase